MSQYFNTYCENKAEAILSPAAIGLWHYSFSYKFRWPSQLWFLLSIWSKCPCHLDKQWFRGLTERYGRRSRSTWNRAVNGWVYLWCPPPHISLPFSPAPCPLSAPSHTVPKARHPKSWLRLWDFLRPPSLPPDTIPQSELTCYSLDWLSVACKFRKDLLGFPYLLAATKSSMVVRLKEFCIFLRNKAGGI